MYENLGVALRATLNSSRPNVCKKPKAIPKPQPKSPKNIFTKGWKTNRPKQTKQRNHKNG